MARSAAEASADVPRTISAASTPRERNAMTVSP
jgi:hypothetical protein